MTSSVLASPMAVQPVRSSAQHDVELRITGLMTSLRKPETLTAAERRQIIARYTAVLEGNFIYWMTSALLAIQSDKARPIILENLHEEVRDSHPVMLRRFAIAAHAFPTDVDALAIDEDLTKVRLFLGRLSGVQTLLTMAFFEGFIQQFMAYLADLAVAQGSTDMEYTDVHGVCDVAHTEGLFNALPLEMAINPLSPEMDMFEGVDLLTALIRRIVLTEVEVASA